VKINTENIETTLNSFADYVIQQARSRLTKGGTNASKELYNSLKKEVRINPNSIELDIEAKEYWKFIDYGVKGTESGKSNNGYKYTNKKPPVKAFIKWAKVKPIKPRDKQTGRFITDKQFGFIMQNHIFKHGIKPTKFLTTPFEKAFNSLPNEVIEAYGLDFEGFIDFTLNKK
jgi:hypothetical protein